MTCNLCGNGFWSSPGEINGWRICRDCIFKLAYQTKVYVTKDYEPPPQILKVEAAKR